MLAFHLDPDMQIIHVCNEIGWNTCFHLASDVELRMLILGAYSIPCLCRFDCLDLPLPQLNVMSDADEALFAFTPEVDEDTFHIQVGAACSYADVKIVLFGVHSCAQAPQWPRPEHEPGPGVVGHIGAVTSNRVVTAKSIVSGSQD
jgi:hypothetical protein